MNGAQPPSPWATFSSSGTSRNSKVASSWVPGASGAAIMYVLSRAASTSDVRGISTVSKPLTGRTKPPASSSEPLLAWPYEMNACSPARYALVAVTISAARSSL